MNPVVDLPPECDAVVIDARSIARRVDELGHELSERFPGEQLALVTVLRGGVFFLADLCRSIENPVTIDFLAVAPYEPGSGGAVRVTKDLDDSITGAHVVLVEDVIDTGLTVNFVISFLRSHSPASLTVCTLFDKPSRRIVPVKPDLVGFELSDDFLVGYGLDLRGRYRNLGYLARVRREVVLG